MQTFIPTEVSQFAKQPFPTLKANAAKGLAVSQQPKNFLHTPTHTGEKTQTNETMKAFDSLSLIEKITTGKEILNTQNLINFVTLIQTLHPNFKVAFTAHPYLKNDFDDCKTSSLDLFLNLVQTFTLLHHSNRKTEVENVLVTADEDYLQAYQLWQHCQPQKQSPVFLPTLQRVANFIQYKYSNQPFTSLNIAAQLNYSVGYMDKLLTELLHQNRIELIEPNKHHCKLYKIVNQ